MLTTAIALNAALFMASTNVHAAEPEAATSTNKVQFNGDNTDPTDPINPVDPIDPTNPGTGNSGPLSIDYVSNIDFGIQEVSSNTEVYQALNEKPYVQVTDKTGSGDGWLLTAQATEFKNSDGSKTLKGAELSFLNGQTGTTAANISTAPTVNQSVIFTNQAAQEVMKAEVGAGKGTWTDNWSGTANANENVLLKVLPGSADATSYQATITWTLTSGPTAS